MKKSRQVGKPPWRTMAMITAGLAAGLLLVLLSSCRTVIREETARGTPKAAQALLPLDPRVTSGTLENGLR